MMWSEDAEKSCSASNCEAPDPRLLRAIQEYLAALTAGLRPDHQPFLSRHAKVAGQLTACLEGLDLVYNAAPALRQVVCRTPPFQAEMLVPLACEPDGSAERQVPEPRTPIP
jgi:hypothetical protein